MLVNDERLIEVAKWCSQTGFNKDSADIPVSLFREVKHSAEEYTERSLTIREMNKEEFVEPPMAQRASNEDEWFDRTAINTLTFTEFEDGVFVAVSFEPVDGKDTLINLKLSWRFQLDLRKCECWQLRYIQIRES